MLVHFWGVTVLLGLLLLAAVVIARALPPPTLRVKPSTRPIDNASLLQALSRTKRGTVYRSTITNRSARR